MEAYQASLAGTLRVILILALAWLVLRWVARLGKRQQRPPAQHTRSQGDVRVENSSLSSTIREKVEQHAVDADFEEVK